jgi:hypothetical protein
MTQNKKKGIAKKALSISLVAAMLATSNVPAWAGGFTAEEDFSVEAQDFLADSNLLEAPAPENFTAPELKTDGTSSYVEVGTTVNFTTDLVTDATNNTSIAISVKDQTVTKTNDTDGAGQTPTATYTAVKADVGQKLTATLTVGGAAAGTVTKEFYVVDTTFNQADYVDSFELNANTAWNTAKTALLNGVAATLKSNIDAAYTVSGYKLVWDDGSDVTTISANDVGKSVKGIATLSGPGLSTGEIIETASVVLTADNNAANITDIKWEGSSEDGKAVFTYDGAEHKPVIKSFVYNGKTYKPNADAKCSATYTYPTELVDVSKGQITANITIDPGFSGSVTSDYEIKAISLTGATFTVNKDFTYLSDGAYTLDEDKEITISKNGTTLKRGTDYTVSIALVDENKVGDQLQITVEGKGNYTGTLSKTVAIKGMDISDWAIGTIDDQTWTGNAITPALTFMNADKSDVDMVKGTDYEVTFTNNVNVGTAKVTVKGIGNYTGNLTTTFEIVANDAAWDELITTLNEDLQASADQNGDEFVYTGKPITWVKDVYASGKFIRGTHFTVTYAPQNTNVGTVKMTVKGKGV